MSEELGKTVDGKNNSFNLKKEVFEWFYTIAIALLIVVIVKGFLFDLVVVDGPSMYPTLTDGDRLIVTRLGYEPEQQDIIVLDSTYRDRMEYYDTKGNLNFAEQMIEYTKIPKNLKKKYYVKRIVALEGQTVDIVDKKVYVDGAPLDESAYYNGETLTYDANMKFPFTVSEGNVFVLGDNRPQSKDSRSSELGEVPIEAIMGKCAFRFLPIQSFGGLE